MTPCCLSSAPAMAAAETATVFLETSLGTRLVVSFPARATTVADLKRQVSAEHAACFPRTGPIAVASFQIKLDGSWFQLTDSMVVEAAFEWVQGPRRLLVEAHELRPHHPVAPRKDARCGTTADAEAEPSAGRPVFAEDSSQFMLAPAEVPGGGGHHASGSGVSDAPQLKNQQDEVVEVVSCQREDGITLPQESSDSDVDLAIGDSGTGTSLANQEDKLQGCAEHASVQLEDVITMPQENSHFDLATGTNNSPLPKLDDKLQGCVEHASGHLEDGISMPKKSSDFDLAAGALPMDQQGRTSMPQESSDLGVTGDKENGCAGDQQKHIIVEPRGKKRFWEEDEADRSIDVNSDDNISPFVSPSSKFVSDKKSSMIEQAKLDSDPLLYNLEDPSHGLLENPFGCQKERWTSGVCSEGGINNGPAIPPCAESMGKDKSSDKEVQTQRGDNEEPQIVGCTDKSSCKGTDVPHYVESMNEGNKRPAPNGHFQNKGENEGATSSVTKEHEPCFRRHHRVAVRKVAMSRAMKLYPVRF